MTSFTEASGLARSAMRLTAMGRKNLMVKTSPSASVSLLAPEFDAFLFASVGDDQNGMLVSVVSALARADVDPWQEAANLARLPAATAITRLASLIAPLPGGLSGHLDPGTNASRLVALLPRGTGSDIVSLEAMRSVGAASKFQHFIHATFIVMALVLGTLTLIAWWHLPAGHGDADAPTSGQIITEVSPPNWGR